MPTDNSHDGAIKAIIDAGKGNIDFIAFALIAVLTFGGLLGGLELLTAVGGAFSLATLWVLMRYALLKIQSLERLRNLREGATMRAQKELAEHATDDDMKDLFKDHERSGGDNEH